MSSRKRVKINNANDYRYCSYCGKKISSTDFFCRYCGKETCHEGSMNKKQVRLSDFTEGRLKAKMKVFERTIPIYCTMCGEEVHINDKVCPHCKKKIVTLPLETQELDTRKCGRCGKTTLYEMNNCPRCGYVLDDKRREAIRKAKKRRNMYIVLAIVGTILLSLLVVFGK